MNLAAKYLFHFQGLFLLHNDCYRYTFNGHSDKSLLSILWPEFSLTCAKIQDHPQKFM